MDVYNDNYGMDQISASHTPPFKMPSTLKYGTVTGNYENQFRAEQYGIPSTMGCNNPDPYIQDDIRKSQRHQKYRKETVMDREAELAEASLEPGFVGDEYRINNGQKMYLSKTGPHHWPDKGSCCSKCKACKTDGASEGFISVADGKDPQSITAKVISIDVMSIILLFMFFVIVVMFLKYSGGMSKIDEMAKLLNPLKSSDPNPNP